MATRRKPDTARKQARRRARLRIGTVKPSHAITPKTQRKPKHKPDDLSAEQ
jgi:hypothetical protein